MPLETITIPPSIAAMQHRQQALDLIDTANDRLAKFMLRDQQVITNFVNCDFHLADQALGWILENHLATGDQFCELGSGWGAVTLLAALRGMRAVGIEIEPDLVDQSIDLADAVQVVAEFYCGSFIPRGAEGLVENAATIEHLDTSEGDVYAEIGSEIADFDLFFAFPWPGESHFFESLLESQAGVGALLLTYRGRDGMKLVRKT